MLDRLKWIIKGDQRFYLVTKGKNFTESCYDEEANVE